MKPTDPDGDSFDRHFPGILSHGGEIPGLAGVPAWTAAVPRPSAIPVLIAVPHAGREYPAAVRDRLRSPGHAPLRLEDRMVDLLGAAVAAATGAGLLVARAPRAMIDLNRSPDDVDWSMFMRESGESVRPAACPGGRAAGGLGLVPRRIPGLGELWRQPHRRGELADRVAGIHVPYHAELGRQLAGLRRRWGAALLLDLHSMPPVTLRGSAAAPEFVLGDRFGATCAGGLTALAFAWFAQGGRLAAHNRPYAGGYALDRHADPARGIHAFQLEIDRSRYLDLQMLEPGPGFAAMAETVAGLVRVLAGEIAELGRTNLALRGGDPGGWAEAAE